MVQTVQGSRNGCYETINGDYSCKYSSSHSRNLTCEGRMIIYLAYSSKIT